jgi:hypothetical protein
MFVVDCQCQNETASEVDCNAVVGPQDEAPTLCLTLTYHTTLFLLYWRMSACEESSLLFSWLLAFLGFFLGHGIFKTATQYYTSILC